MVSQSKSLVSEREKRDLVNLCVCLHACCTFKLRNFSCSLLLCNSHFCLHYPFSFLFFIYKTRENVCETNIPLGPTFAIQHISLTEFQFKCNINNIFLFLEPRYREI